MFIPLVKWIIETHIQTYYFYNFLKLRISYTFVQRMLQYAICICTHISQQSKKRKGDYFFHNEITYFQFALINKDFEKFINLQW